MPAENSLPSESKSQSASVLSELSLEAFPIEILLNISTFLDFKDRSNLYLVSKRFYRLAIDIWKLKFLSYISSYDSNTPDTTPWLKLSTIKERLKIIRWLEFLQIKNDQSLYDWFYSTVKKNESKFTVGDLELAMCCKQNEKVVSEIVTKIRFSQHYERFSFDEEIYNARIYQAITYNNKSVLVFFLQLLAAEQIRKFLVKRETDIYFTTPLHEAVKVRNLEIAEYLIEYLITKQNIMDINITDGHGDAALHLAVRQGDFDMVKLLLNKGANPNFYLVTAYILNDLKSKFVEIPIYGTPLYIASAQGDYKIVKLLVENKADPSVKSNDTLPLEIATKNNHTEIVNFLTGHQSCSVTNSHGCFLQPG